VKRIAVIGALLLLAGCASSPQAPHQAAAATVTAQLPIPDQSNEQPVLAQPVDRVAPLDVVDITVFQVPDLTRTVRVNLAGEISLPLIGSIAAAGRTEEEVEADIAKRLGEKYMRSPNVTVFIKEKHDTPLRRVTVDGAVKQPGVYDIKGATSLMQAIALARGVQETANLKGVVVFRTVNKQRMAARFDLGAIRKGDAPDPELYPDDIVVVDESGLRGRALLRAILTSLPILSVFRPF